jgi:hypothetical protein
LAGRPGLAKASLGFGLAALASCWNPAAAPFGLAVGVGAGVLAARALRAGGRRGVAVAGLVAALAAVAGATLVLALTAGLGRTVGETTLVPQPTPAEVDRALDEAAGRTREARERARAELEQVAPAPGKAP